MSGEQTAQFGIDLGVKETEVWFRNLNAQSKTMKTFGSELGVNNRDLVEKKRKRLRRPSAEVCNRERNPAFR